MSNFFQIKENDLLDPEMIRRIHFDNSNIDCMISKIHVCIFRRVIDAAPLLVEYQFTITFPEDLSESPTNTELWWISKDSKAMFNIFEKVFHNPNNHLNWGMSYMYFTNDETELKESGSFDYVLVRKQNSIVK